MKKFYLLLIGIVLSHFAPGNAFSKDLSVRQLENSVSEGIYKASRIQKKALQYYEQKYGLFSVETLKPMEALAWMDMERGNFQEAEHLYKRIINIRNNNAPPSAENKEGLGAAYFMLGDSYLYRKQYVPAETNYDQSLRLAENPGHRGDVFSRKGIIAKELERYEDAVHFYSEAVREYESAKEANPQKTKQVNKRILNAYSASADIYEKEGDFKKAAEYQNLADALKAGGEKTEAE